MLDIFHSDSGEVGGRQWTGGRRALQEGEKVDGLRRSLDRSLLFFRGAKGKSTRYTPKVFSALRNQVRQQAAKEVWCIPKCLFLRERRGTYIHTKEASRCARGTSSDSVGV